MKDGAGKEEMPGEGSNARGRKGGSNVNKIPHGNCKQKRAVRESTPYIFSFPQNEIFRYVCLSVPN